MLILLIGIAALVVALNYKIANSVLLTLFAICILSLFGGMQVYKKSKQSGFTFYNLRSELAISLIDKSNRSEEHTSELQSRENLVCRLLLEKKNNDKDL